MKKALAFVTLGMALMIASLPVMVTAQKAKDLPVTVMIEGLGLDTTPTLRIQSDQQGAYKDSRTLESIIQAIGDWELDMLNFSGSGRTVLVDLRDPVPNSAPNGATPAVPFAPELVRTRFIAKCTQFGASMPLLANGSSIICPLAVAFDQGGRRYRLAFNDGNFPNVDPVTVTCTGVDSTFKCKQWRIEPSVIQADGERKCRAKLIRVASNKRETDLDMGNFYISFLINVTNP